MILTGTVQTQGLNIRRYSEYLLERVRAYRDTKTDFVKSGAGKMRRLTVEKGLMRQTEVVQDQIEALVRCDVSTSGGYLRGFLLTSRSSWARTTLIMSSP